jgi:pimeloyl-ACP methyl ester carboxylesterase
VTRPIYPFSAMVGQGELKLALIVSVIDPTMGGVLAFGDRGPSEAAASIAIPMGATLYEECRTVIAASNDKAVPSDVAFKVLDLAPGSKVILLRGMGHLAHGEKPAEVAGYVFSEAERYGILSKEETPEPAE